MDRTSRSGEQREGGEARDLRRDVRALAPVSGEGAESALEIWKRRERARALLNARDPRRLRPELRARPDPDRPNGS